MVRPVDTAEVADPALVLWYDRPATLWMNQALPIGNGEIGGMVFGGTAMDHIQFNEKTLWEGGTAVVRRLPELRRHLDHRSGRRDRHRLSAAARHRERAGVGGLHDRHRRVPPRILRQPPRQGDGRPPHRAGRGRERGLRPGGPPQQDAVIDGTSATIAITGKLLTVAYEAQLRVAAQGGQTTATATGLSVRGADAVTLLLSAGTSYDPSPASASYVREDPRARVTAAMDAAAGKSYQALRSAHIADYRALYNRVALDIGQARPTVPTNTLRAGYSGQSRDLEALYFQYGRYLLISSCARARRPRTCRGSGTRATRRPGTATTTRTSTSR